MTPLTKVQQAHNNYLQASDAKTEARHILAKAVADARQQGISLKRIGELLDSSEQAVWNIVSRGK